jgi:hypothetical protein
VPLTANPLVAAAAAPCFFLAATAATTGSNGSNKRKSAATIPTCRYSVLKVLATFGWIAA